MTFKIISNDKVINFFRKEIINSCNKNIISRIKNIQKISSFFYFHEKKYFFNKQPIFTFFLTVHNTNFNLIKKSIQSVLEQDYQNTEIIIINHGCNKEISDYLKFIFMNNLNTKLIVIKDNEFKNFINDTTNRVANIWNFALFISEGEYSIPLACDDFVSKNYVSEIIKLFKENNKCTSILTNVQSVNLKNEINYKNNYLIKLKKENKIYFDNQYLVRNIMDENKMLTPGGNLVVNNNIIIFFGGYSIIHEFMQFFLFSIAGDLGFSKKSTYFWRHHENQTNKLYSSLGIIWFSGSLNWYKKYEVEKFHLDFFGKKFQKKFYKWYLNFIKKNEIGYFRYAYRFYGLKVSFKIIKSIFIQCPIILPSILLYFFIDIPYYVYVRFKLIKKIKNFFSR